MKNYFLGGLLVGVGSALFAAWLAWFALPTYVPSQTQIGSVVFPFSIGTIGPELVKFGVIDPSKFQSQYLEKQKSKLEIGDTNARELLNILWAFGLANKNEILEKGPMMDAQFGGAGNFASTGGWTLAVGDSMDHYSHHQMILLDTDQQERVNNVSKRIFRPCCRNPAYFPDCNHGMAMLGLLELMARHDMDEQEMEHYANRVNTKWFPGYSNSSCAV